MLRILEITRPRRPPRSGGEFFGNNKTPPRSGGKFLSFFKVKTVNICNKNTDLWTTINPRRRRGKFLKTTKTRREAAEIFLETTRPRTENSAKISLWEGLNVISPVTNATSENGGRNHGLDVGSLILVLHADARAWAYAALSRRAEPRGTLARHQLRENSVW